MIVSDGFLKKVSYAVHLGGHLNCACEISIFKFHNSVSIKLNYVGSRQWDDLVLKSPLICFFLLLSVFS